jgi:hypothetical protein
MPFDPSTVNKRVQYITVDSEFVASTNVTIGGYSMGGNNNFSVNFGTSTSNNNGTYTVTSSNIFVQEMRNVIGLKLVDFYVTQIATIEQVIGNTNPLAVKYIDVLCPDLPDQAQILDERKSKIFARVPLERDFSGTSNIIVNDKQWKSFTRQTNYFNPISIKQLNFQLWELTGQNTTLNPTGPGTYQPLQPDANFYMVLEVTTVDYEAVTLPKEDPQVKVVEAIKSLEDKFVGLMETLPAMIQASVPDHVPLIEKLFDSSKVVPAVPAPVPELVAPEPKKLDVKTYIIIALIILLALYMFSSKK